MDKDLAKFVAATARRSSVELTDLVPTLKGHCDEPEYQALLKAIATATATIHFEIEKKIFAQYPELEQEFEAKIRKYGRLI
jgi:hypothetical protein